jgi:hypothetical protein
MQDSVVYMRSEAFA